MMTPMEKIFALFVDPVDSGWGKPLIALFYNKTEPMQEWPGYHLWVGWKFKRHYQVWPVNKRFLKTWD